MSKAWTDITASDIDEESFVTETLLGQFFDNQEALISSPIDCRFAQAVTSGSPAAFTELVTQLLFIPPQVATTAGNVNLVLHFERWTDAATTIEVRVKLGAAGTYVTQTGITDTGPVFSTFTISDTDTKAAADGFETLFVEARVSAGVGEARVQNLDSACRVERAA